jgi:hypothetical protein
MPNHYLLLPHRCETLENLLSFSPIGDRHVVTIAVVGSYGVEGPD